MTRASKPKWAVSTLIQTGSSFGGHAIGYWRLNETSGLSADNIGSAGAAGDGFIQGFGSGNGTLGEPGPRPTDFPGFASTNNAPEFEQGTSRIESSDTEFDITGALTLEAWVNPDGLGGDNRQIFGKYDSTGNNRAYGMRINENTGTLQLFVSPDGTFGSGLTVESSTSVQANEWTHVAAVFKPNDYVRIFINGDLDASEEVDANVPGSITNASEDLFIGARDDGAANRFGGLIDEAAIYDTALSDERIKAHYDAAVVIPEPASLTLIGAGMALLLRGRRRLGK